MRVYLPTFHNTNRQVLLPFLHRSERRQIFLYLRGSILKPYYQEGGQTIYHGDCRDILPQLGIFDLVLTDPPYGVNLRYHNYIDTPENLDRLISETFVLIRSAGVVILLTPGVTNIFRYPEPDWILCWRSGAGTSSGKWGFTTWQPI